MLYDVIEPIVGDLQSLEDALDELSCALTPVHGEIPRGQVVHVVFGHEGEQGLSIPLRQCFVCRTVLLLVEVGHKIPPKPFSRTRRGQALGPTVATLD